MRSDQKTAPEPSHDYVQRVNAAINCILANLDQPLNLGVVARAACFSPFHFHRLFRALVGEPLSQFVKRVRLDRALALLSREPKRSLTDIALSCGFGSSSDFSRSFRQRYGVPPSAFDIETFRRQRRADWQAAVADPPHRHLLERLPPGENPDGFRVEVRRMPARCVAYVRVMNSYRVGAVPQAAERLVAWAEARGLADGQWLGYTWDDPEIVAHANCRYDVGLEVHDLIPEGEVCRFDFPPMQVAQVEVCGPIDLEVRALDWLFRTWLPTSGYLPIDQPCFEAWLGRPFEHGFERFELLLQLPIAPA